MKCLGDIETVNLSTGDRWQRISGDGESILRKSNMRDVWIPEAPNHPGLYANENGTDIKGPGKIQPHGLQPATMSAEHAKQFATRDECQAWCDANPSPKFSPQQHGFYDVADFSTLNLASV